jgi:hypothetical protein
VVIKSKALAVWGSGAVLVLGAGIVVGHHMADGAAPAKTTSTVASMPQGLPFPATPKDSRDKGNGGNGNGARSGTSGKALQVTHQVIGFPAPGASAPLRLMVTNRNSQAVKLISVQAEITAVRPLVPGSKCTTADFSVPAYDGPFETVAKNGGTSTLTLSLEMLATAFNQDGCKGASIDFTYSVSGDKA